MKPHIWLTRSIFKMNMWRKDPPLLMALQSVASYSSKNMAVLALEVGFFLPLFHNFWSWWKQTVESPWLVKWIFTAALPALSLLGLASCMEHTQLEAMDITSLVFSVQMMCDFRLGMRCKGAAQMSLLFTAVWQEVLWLQVLCYMLAKAASNQ